MMRQLTFLTHHTVGAHAVLLGRPFMWGLALGGQEGVEQVLRGLLADLEVTMGLAGLSSVKDMKKSILSPSRRSCNCKL